MSSSVPPAEASGSTSSGGGGGDTPQRPVHLVVAVHGLWGESRHLNSVCKALALRHGGIILKPEHLLDDDDDDDTSSVKSKSKQRKSKAQANKKKTNEAPSEPGASTESLTSTIHTKGEGQLDKEGKPKSRSWLKGLIDEPPSDVPRAEGQCGLVVLNTTSNHASHTYDGIDWLAERAALEVNESVKRMKTLPEEDGGGNVVRVSFIGYSLGGLVCRYLVALLDSQGFYTSIEPVNFLTLATPHAGIPPGKGWFGQLSEYIGSRLLSRTGEQLYVRDSGWDALSTTSSHPATAAAAGGGPASSSSSSSGKKGDSSLLSAMAKPGSPFVKALARFPRVTLYSNAINDWTVPLRTGGLTTYDPALTYGIERVQVKVNKEYPSIVESLQVLAPEGEEEASLPLPRRLWRSLKKRKLPFLLNPKRYPFKAPLNYLAVLALPVLLPILVTAIIYRFSSENRKSRKRIALLRREWAKRNGAGSKGDVEEARGAKALKEDEEDEELHDRSRIERMLRSVVQSVAEDRVGEDDGSSAGAHGDSVVASKSAAVHPGNGDASRAPSAKLPSSEPLSSTLVENPTPSQLEDQAKVLTPLRPCQEEMIVHLRDRELLPNLVTKLAWFDGVINSHAVIIARTPQMEMHRRGLPVLRHLADHFIV